MKYLDKNNEVLGSSLAQAIDAPRSRSVQAHDSIVIQFTKLQIQFVIADFIGEAQLQTTHLIKDLENLIGKN